jgi:phospholipid transport system substrate-binding protein
VEKLIQTLVEKNRALVAADNKAASAK